MGFVFICFIGLAIIATIIYVIDNAYFSNKKPEETLEEIDENIGKDVFTPNFESEFQMIRTALLALL